MAKRREQTTRSADRVRPPTESTVDDESEETPLERVRASLQQWLTDVRSALAGRDSTDESEPRHPSRPDGGAATSQQDHPLLAVDPELLDPEQRITQLLLQEDGRIPQAEIVERTRWTSSTVSRRLGDMESRDIVERRRFAGGKTVFLSDEAGDTPLRSN
jgi:hypothetical protein